MVVGVKFKLMNWREKDGSAPHDFGGILKYFSDDTFMVSCNTSEL